MITDTINEYASSTYSVLDANGNYTKTVTSADGQPWGSSSHTREDGGTNNNNIVYNGSNYNPAASYNALKALDRTQSLILSPKGNPLDIKADRIFVKKGGEAYHTFKEIKGAIKAGKLPQTFSNDGNAVDDFELVELVYMSSSTAWAAVDTRFIDDKHGQQYKESEAINMQGPNVVLKYSTLYAKA